LPSGALVLAHNSHNAADSLGPYLEQVRDPGRFRESVNVVLDPARGQCRGVTAEPTAGRCDRVESAPPGPLVTAATTNGARERRPCPPASQARSRAHGPCP
jgi:hypothetical protein